MKRKQRKGFENLSDNGTCRASAASAITAAPVALSRFFAIVFLALLTSSPLWAAGTQTVPTVVVSILPQSEFVNRIAGDRVKVLTLVGPGASPHTYEPTPRQMAELSGASVWFTVGVEFENALLPKVKALYPRLKIVDTSKNVVFRTLEANSQSVLAAGLGVADESGRDPHIWLGLDASKIQLAVVMNTLSAMKPADADFFRANHDAYMKDIETIFASLKKDLAPLRGSTVFVYHPSFGYFFDNFGIIQEAVEVGGKEPTQKTLAALIKLARDDKAKVIFVQKQFPAAAAGTVAKAIGGLVVEIDPLAPDWIENIKAMGAALKKTITK